MRFLDADWLQVLMAHDSPHLLSPVTRQALFALKTQEAAKRSHMAQGRVEKANLAFAIVCSLIEPQMQALLR